MKNLQDTGQIDKTEVFGVLGRVVGGEFLSMSNNLDHHGVTPLHDSAVAGLTNKLIRLYDTPHHGDVVSRERAADVATILSRRYDSALALVCSNAEHYSALMADVSDANPYHPNGIDVLSRVTNRAEVRVFLADLQRRYAGFSQAEISLALAVFEATARAEESLSVPANWPDPVEYARWKATLTEEEGRCLSLALGSVTVASSG